MSLSNWSLARTGFFHLLPHDYISCHYFIIWWLDHKMSENFEQSTVSLSLVQPDNSFLSPCDQKIWENFEKSTHRIPLSTDFEKSTGFLSPRLPHADPLTSGSLGTLHSRPSSQEIKKNSLKKEPFFALLHFELLLSWCLCHLSTLGRRLLTVMHCVVFLVLVCNSSVTSVNIIVLVFFTMTTMVITIIVCCYWADTVAASGLPLGFHHDPTFLPHCSSLSCSSTTRQETSLVGASTLYAGSTCYPYMVTGTLSLFQLTRYTFSYV